MRNQYGREKVRCEKSIARAKKDKNEGQPLSLDAGELCI